jgi:hypothetical protein
MAQSKNATDAAVRINNESSRLRASDEAAPEQLSDEILVIQVARGNGAALATLYDRYSSTVLGISLKVVAISPGGRYIAGDVLASLEKRRNLSIATGYLHKLAFQDCTQPCHRCVSSTECPATAAADEG